MAAMVLERREIHQPGNVRRCEALNQLFLILTQCTGAIPCYKVNVNRSMEKEAGAYSKAFGERLDMAASKVASLAVENPGNQRFAADFG